MNLKNFFTLTIRATDFNLVAQQPELLKQLRKLTIHSGSGLNYEMDRMIKDIQTRPVRCKIILAYHQPKPFSTRELVGWALLSNEDSKFYFFGTMATNGSRFKKEDGWLFEVYVDPKHRRQGVASAILKKARKITKKEVLCVAPWDYRSTAFYEKLPEDLTKWL
jgi:GNAT superfamily N-acetyltransferase